MNSLLKADNGNNGRNKDRFGKSADHKVIEVPVGTIVRTVNGKIIGDLDKEGSMFLAARGGAGRYILEEHSTYNVLKFTFFNRIYCLQRWQRKSLFRFKQRAGTRDL